MSQIYVAHNPTFGDGDFYAVVFEGRGFRQIRLFDDYVGANEFYTRVGLFEAETGQAVSRRCISAFNRVVFEEETR
jgi:hypothetical protein